MSKVVLLKYIPSFRPVAGTLRQHQQQAPQHISSSAVVVSTSSSAAGELLVEIQGYPPVPRKERAKSWNLFKQVLRDLLGIQATEAISVRFAYPPYDAISALSAILQEPNHVVQLVVSKLPNASSTNHIWVDSKKTAEVQNNHTADPYCRLRKTHPNTVRTKCNLEEMNKLFSQLTEVSLSLQRTQQECDQIARRCRLTEQTDTTTTTTTPVVCPQQSKCMVFDDDSKIERLITAAESITQHAAKNSSKNPVSPYQYHSVLEPASGVLQRPDPPTGVYVRRSFAGGAHVMWNPVSLSASNENRGQRVMGYEVHVNRQPAVVVEGCLASQAELPALEDGYHCTIQVCTHAEHCDSELSAPLTYRHEVHNRTRRKSLPDSPLHRTTTAGQKQQKKVELWLENGHKSKRGGRSSGDDARFNETAPELSAEQLPLPRVRLDDGKINITQVSDITSRLLEDRSSCKDDDDAKSTSSSHTSGIVTDYLSTPKLSPAFEFNQSSCSSPSHHSTSVFSTAHSQPDSHLQQPPHRRRHHHGCMFKDGAVTPSTLCPSPHLSTLTLDDDDTLDTIIDEPLAFRPAATSTSRSAVVKRSPCNVKGPASPQNFRVSNLPRAGSLTVSWTPVRRDLKGCSNGLYVLGYRVYINGSQQQSVDGAMTLQTTVQCPPSVHLQGRRMEIHVRTRSIAGESLPSNTVTYDLLLQRVLESGTKTTNSVQSGSACASLDPAESLSSHTVPARKYLHLPTRSRLETCI